MHDSKFIADDDIVYFNNHNIDYNVDVPLFIQELCNHLNNVWPIDWQIENNITLDELNHTYLEQYPSWGGYHILDSAFTGENTEILSTKSKIIFARLYGIVLR